MTQNSLKMSLRPLWLVFALLANAAYVRSYSGPPQVLLASQPSHPTRPITAPARRIRSTVKIESFEFCIATPAAGTLLPIAPKHMAAATAAKGLESAAIASATRATDAGTVVELQ